MNTSIPKAALQLAPFGLFLSLLSLPQQAQALSFSFSFTNAANGGGTVTGIIDGLSDNAAFQQASSVQVLSNDLGFGIGEYIGRPSRNGFTVVDGELTSFFFLGFGSRNTAPEVTCCSLILRDNFPVDLSALDAGLTENPRSVRSNPESGQSLVIRPVPEASSVPGLLVFGTACTGLAILSKKKFRLN